MVPDVNVPLVEGDVVWVVGEKEDVYQLIDQKSEKMCIRDRSRVSRMYSSISKVLVPCFC